MSQIPEACKNAKKSQGQKYTKQQQYFFAT
jgi:hypothetical protein